MKDGFSSLKVNISAVKIASSKDASPPAEVQKIKKKGTGVGPRMSLNHLQETASDSDD